MTRILDPVEHCGLPPHAAEAVTRAIALGLALNATPMGVGSHRATIDITGVVPHIGLSIIRQESENGLENSLVHRFATGLPRKGVTWNGYADYVERLAADAEATCTLLETLIHEATE